MKLCPIHLILTLSLGCAGAHGMDLNTLVERSPFAPPGVQNVEPADETPVPLEFRGIASDESGTMFSVYDLTTNRGYWVREGESKGDSGAILVKSFDAAENQLVVEQGGRTLPLKLKRATVAGGPPSSHSPYANAGNRMAANSATDPQRLEAVAAEVRRRRVLRSAAQVGAPATTAPAQVSSGR